MLAFLPELYATKVKFGTTWTQCSDNLHSADFHILDGYFLKEINSVFLVLPYENLLLNNCIPMA